MTWVIRIYTLLLRLYPPEFRDEFAEEMTAVFIEALSEAQKRGRLLRLFWCGKEFFDLLTLLVREQWLSLRREEAVMNPILSANHAHDADAMQAETPLEILAGIFPFILFGLMFTLLGFNYHMQSALMRNGMVGYLIVHGFLLVGLGIGWALRFPRWSYAYLGAVVLTSSWLAGIATVGFRIFGYTFGREEWGWRGWMPLLALTAVMLLFTRSLQPLVQLFQGIRRDWTRFSFGLYAALAWLLLLITYDGKTWYNQTLYLPLNLFLLTLVITGGTFVYMYRRRPWPRVLALQATLILYFLVSALVTTLDGHQEFGSPPTAFGWLTYLLFLLMWVSVPLLPGLAHQAWRRLRPI